MQAGILWLFGHETTTPIDTRLSSWADMYDESKMWQTQHCCVAFGCASGIRAVKCSRVPDAPRPCCCGKVQNVPCAWPLCCSVQAPAHLYDRTFTCLACRTHLAHALRIADVRQELLETLAAVSDFSYGWGLLDAHLDRLQAEVCDMCVSFVGGSSTHQLPCFIGISFWNTAFQASMQPSGSCSMHRG